MDGFGDKTLEATRKIHYKMYGVIVIIIKYGKHEQIIGKYSINEGLMHLAQNK